MPYYISVEVEEPTEYVTKDAGEAIVKRKTLLADYIYPAVGKIMLDTTALDHIYCDKNLGKVMAVASEFPAGGKEVTDLTKIKPEGRVKIVKSGGVIEEYDPLSVKKLSRVTQ